MNETSSVTSAQPPVITTRHELHRAVAGARKAGKSIGLVPTMGALHRGHLALVEASTSECDFTVVTVFVNPIQFQPGEDYQRYPRDLRSDQAALSEFPVDCVFAPTQDEMYPPGYSTFVDPPEVARPLEGASRPGHFRGVTTIVLKLFHLIPADVAYFGHKDYQQSLVVRRMVEDLDLPLTIRVCPTVRDPDGLAVSSRNVYLTPREREQAIALPRALALAADWVRQGERDAQAISAGMRQELAAAGIRQIDYAALVHPETLAEVRSVNQATIAAVAAHVGSTRLIDNRLIG